MLTVEAETKTSEELYFDGSDSNNLNSTMAPEPPSRSQIAESPGGCGCITVLIVITVMGWILWQSLS